jgi:hypothetical protein
LNDTNDSQDSLEDKLSQMEGWKRIDACFWEFLKDTVERYKWKSYSESAKTFLRILAWLVINVGIRNIDSITEFNSRQLRTLIVLTLCTWLCLYNRHRPCNSSAIETDSIIATMR